MSERDVVLLERAWQSAPQVGFGRHCETSALLHETRRLYVTRIYDNSGRTVKQFAETPAIGEKKVGYDENLEAIESRLRIVEREKDELLLILKLWLREFPQPPPVDAVASDGRPANEAQRSTLNGLAYACTFLTRLCGHQMNNTKENPQ